MYMYIYICMCAYTTRFDKIVVSVRIQIACACLGGLLVQDIRQHLWANEHNICIFPKFLGKVMVRTQPTHRAHETWRAIIEYAEDHCIGSRCATCFIKLQNGRSFQIEYTCTYKNIYCCIFYFILPTPKYISIYIYACIYIYIHTHFYMYISTYSENS